MIWLLVIWGAMASPLELGTVLEAVDERVPLLAVAEAELEAAEARLLAAQGAFDPTFNGRVSSYSSQNPRQKFYAELGGRTLIGPEIATGYRRGTGDFPNTYDGDDKTVAEGEWMTRVEVPLLDGLWYDEERAKRDASRWKAGAKGWEMEAKRLVMRLKATEAYWNWVAAGARLRVDAQLLEVAEQRARAFGRQVEEGARAEIDLLDNERVLYERRDDVAQAGAKLEISAQVLSLYYRDDDGRPIVPPANSLPNDLEREVAARNVEEDLGLAAARPDLKALEEYLRAQEAIVRGARNSLLPDLDVALEHNRPLDGSQAETIAGVQLSVPMGFRRDRGQLGESRATLAALRAELLGQRDRAAAEVLSAHAAWVAAQRRVEVTREGRLRAQRVVEMERRRIELGGTQIFNLLLREEKAAKAGKAAVDAALAARLAEAQLEAVAPAGPE